MAIFARLGRLVKGFFGLFISGLEERNPEALAVMARGSLVTRKKQLLLSEALRGTFSEHHAFLRCADPGGR